MSVNPLFCIVNLYVFLCLFVFSYLFPQNKHSKTVKKISNPVLTYKSSNFRINFARICLFVKKTLSHDDFSPFVKLFFFLFSSLHGFSVGQSEDGLVFVLLVARTEEQVGPGKVPVKCEKKQNLETRLSFRSEIKKILVKSKLNLNLC